MGSFFKRTIAFTKPQMEGLQKHLHRLGLKSISELVRRIIDEWLEKESE